MICAFADHVGASPGPRVWRPRRGIRLRSLVARNDVMVQALDRGANGGAVQPPTSSLFTLHVEPGSRVLVETDPRFTQDRMWRRGNLC